ncbi:MAG: DUF1559 domain-containing protein [Planctomycetaceae bacterium]|nr:DUF1559 domain-containing protein [Planctomycetaceae bacterium]
MWKPKVLEISVAVMAVLAVVGIAVPMATRIRDNSDRLACLENLRQIGIGIRQWSLAHDYALPPGRGMSGFCNSDTGEPLRGNLYAIEPGLNALWDKGRGVITDVNVFRCPGDRNLEPPPAIGEDFTSAGQLSYGMTGDLYPTDVPNKVVVADKSDRSLPDGARRNCAHHGHRLTNVLFFDGSVRSCDGPYLPPGVGSELGSIYIRESGSQNDTYIH